MGGDCEGEPMSILIHGKMPTKGKLPTESTFKAWFYPSGVVAFYDSNGNSLGASKWKELPPHGRLINADDIENITVIMNENGSGFNRIIAPIIIPADQEKE